MKKKLLLLSLLGAILVPCRLFALTVDCGTLGNTLDAARRNLANLISSGGSPSAIASLQSQVDALTAQYNTSCGGDTVGGGDPTPTPTPGGGGNPPPPPPPSLTCNQIELEAESALSLQPDTQLNVDALNSYMTSHYPSAGCLFAALPPVIEPPTGGGGNPPPVVCPDGTHLNVATNLCDPNDTTPIPTPTPGDSGGVPPGVTPTPTPVVTPPPPTDEPPVVITPPPPGGDVCDQLAEEFLSRDHRFHELEGREHRGASPTLRREMNQLKHAMMNAGCEWPIKDRCHKNHHHDGHCRGYHEVSDCHKHHKHDSHCAHHFDRD